MNPSLLRDFTHHLLGAPQTQSMYPPEHLGVTEANRSLLMRTAEIFGRRGEIHVAPFDKELAVDGRPLPADVRAPSATVRRQRLPMTLPRPGNST